MLSVILFLPLAGSLAILALPRERGRLIKQVALASVGATFALIVGVWLAFRPGEGFGLVQRVPWIPSLGVGYVVGVDGLSLPLVALTGLLFAAATVYSLHYEERAKEYFAVLLFLETASLGVFLALDLFLFYVFWDLNLVGMYFLIGMWGHGERERSALKFFLYTLAGSLAMLLAILGLFLATSPFTLDMQEIVSRRPLDGAGPVAVLVWLGFFLAFAIKTPLVPFHTWLPPAHVDAPAPGSAILAGVLLKMGTYGFLRILLPMLPETSRRFALALGLLALVSVLYGALVALAQRDYKRMVAYTSVNHMGYVILGVAAAAALASGQEGARTLALNGAVYQMVSHGLITGALFLMAGVLWERGRTYDMQLYGGLARRAPLFAGLLGLAAFGSLGLPGLSGFVAELQVFLGTFGVYPWLAGLALLGILITAALYLRALQRLLLGELPPRWEGFSDLDRREASSLIPLLVLVVVLGLLPAWLLAVIEPASRTIVDLLR